MSAYTIRELENLSGIKAHTIRIWEKRYGLIAPQRTSTNIRTYCDTELKKLLNVSILNRNGLKISKIAQLSTDEIIAKISQFTSATTTSAESQIESLILAMIDLDDYRFEQVLARTVIQFGFEDAVTTVLYPFFVRIGIMWQTGSINPAQEHFVSNLVKQKLYVAIDGLVVNFKHNARRFVFFLPEGELHEIGLLFFCFLVKKRGHHTLYLGQSMPLSDLSDIALIYQFDYMVTSLTTSFAGKDLVKFTKLLSEEFPEKVIFIFGSRISDLADHVPSNTVLLASPNALLQELDKISS
jgi:DNA-binding transcriptional MerR regulator